MKKTYNGKSYFYPLVVLNILTWVLLPFALNFNLVNNEPYHFAIFGFSILVTFTSLLIVIAELISLKIDRTATKNTFFSALFIFIGLISSKDIFYSLNLFIPNIYTDLNIYVNYVSPIVFNISYSLGLYFLLKFFENDYKIKKYSLKILIGLALFNALNILYVCLGLEVGVIVTNLTQALFMILIGGLYLRKAQKSDKTTAILTYFIFISFSFAFALNAFMMRGLQIFFHLSICFSFVFIYLNFFINKTNIVYRYDDENKNKEVNKILTVKCFQCFDCFIDDEIVVFPSKKCKEFFALLIVLNGKTLTMDKAITYLYPDKDIEKAKISYRDIVWRLRKLFEDLSFNGIIFRRGETTLLKDHIKCDYIDVINHKKKYDGSPLMPEYDWSFEFENLLEN